MTDSTFDLETSPQPDGHPPLSPPEGSVAIKNPPAMIWRVDDRAATYTVELSQSGDFSGDVIQWSGIDRSYHNGDQVLAEGEWYWRYTAVASDGTLSTPSSISTFWITPESIPLPVAEDVVSEMPDHPRVFVTPDTLDAFRAQKDGSAREAWKYLEHQVEGYLDQELPELDLVTMPGDVGEDRGHVFYVDAGRPMSLRGFSVRDLNAAATRVNALSFAYLISEDSRYADAARRWLKFVIPFRVDYHLEDRGQHDTVVYCYEYGLKGVALAFDRLFHVLSEGEKGAILGHLEYHCEAAYQWIHDRMEIHLNYQNSHGQQCMHALLTTVMAFATDTEKGAKWADYLIRQYVNRVAWGNNDGGYTEGQKYGHKVQFMLEGLAALKTATGLDLFREPRWQNTGVFWMYCMSMNYWWNHWGDCYSLIDSNLGSDADTYITSFLASMTDNRYVKWWSDTRVCNPVHLPMWYLSGSGVEGKPPVDIASARVFPEVGQLAAFDRMYDHRSNRIFFRSSPWGGHSHAHSDQNGFVLHAGGEIMACDAGYYTYSGDTYHVGWSRTTQAHNSVLVNDMGQPKGINYNGRIGRFFNSPTYCSFVGDASAAYGEDLNRFERKILYIRPDVTIVLDELKADTPSRFSWVLNTFEQADLGKDQSMVVRQRDQRLVVKHVSPQGLTYSQNNDRPFPMKTKAWCRFTEAFPQHWNIRVSAEEERTEEQMLTVMHSYSEGKGERIRNLRRIDVSDGVGVSYECDEGQERVLFRSTDDGEVVSNDITSSGEVASVLSRESTCVRWFLGSGKALKAGEARLFDADDSCDVSVDLSGRSCAAHINIEHRRSVEIRLWLPAQPTSVYAGILEASAGLNPVDFEWSGNSLALVCHGSGETIFWVDPKFDPLNISRTLRFELEDNTGLETVDLETAIAENGEVVGFCELDPREPGEFELTANGAHILVQDAWDPDLSVEGQDRIVGLLRERTEIFVRYAPDQVPVLKANIQKSCRDKLVNLVCNGGFEAGIPDYPPRFWNVQHPRTHDPGWPGWSKEDAAAGQACVRFLRPRDPISLKSRPMRLRRGGSYQLRFKARGEATHASVTVSGEQGTAATVAVAPSEEWREYSADVDVRPGYCTVSISFNEGGEDDQVVWVDDVKFGYFA